METYILDSGSRSLPAKPLSVCHCKISGNRATPIQNLVDSSDVWATCQSWKVYLGVRSQFWPPGTGSPILQERNGELNYCRVQGWLQLARYQCDPLSTSATVGVGVSRGTKQILDWTLHSGRINGRFDVRSKQYKACLQQCLWTNALHCGYQHGHGGRP